MCRRWWIVAIVVLGGCVADQTPASPATATATVVRVIDGDTIDVRIAGRDERVRLIGIDTPETVKPEAPVECYGPEASAFTKQLLPEGTPVRLERDVVGTVSRLDRDAFGRLPGRFVNRRSAGRVLLEGHVGE